MSFRFHKIVPRRRQKNKTAAARLLISSKSCRRRTNAIIIGIVVLVLPFLSITTLAPLMRSLSTSWSLPTTSESNFSPFHISSRVETVFLDGEPFTAKLRTHYRNTDVIQSFPYTDSSDFEGIMERRIFPQHDHDNKCVPMSGWQSTFYPTCNEFHAFDATDALVDRDLWMISNKGYWRYAWEVVENRMTQWTDKSWETYSHDSSIVLRTFKIEHTYSKRYFENNRVDAIAMERLTKSPYVMNMFGFCGMSVVTEYAGKHVAQVVDKLKPLKKLELAKMIAQGVADVHGIDDQVSLVHNDLNFANIVIGNKHGRPLINDFNIAVLMMKRNDTGEACTFASHYPNPQWRGPEEQVDEDGKTSKLLTEKVDIYALGNVMFRFAVGHSPWKHAQGRSLTPDEKQELAKLKMTNGALPDVPHEVQHSQNPATKSLLSIMRECYRHQPELRPSAKEIVEQLQIAIDEYRTQLQIAIDKYRIQLKESDNKGGEEKMAEKDHVHGRKLTVKKYIHNETKDRHEKVNSS